MIRLSTGFQGLNGSASSSAAWTCVLAGSAIDNGGVLTITPTKKSIH
jgi:hypothetical protein